LIKDHLHLHQDDPSVTVPADCDPYDLNKPYPYGLRALKLDDVPIFPFTDPSSAILLRDAYVDMYGKVVEHFHDSFHQGRSQGAIVSGQPGIGETQLALLLVEILSDFVSGASGKTVFLFFVLLQCILDAQPTVLRYRDGSVIVFIETGVRWLEAHDFDRHSEVYPDGTWALVNAQFTIKGDSTGTPSGDFLGARFFVVHNAILSGPIL
jgi:hypothetical protein